MTYSIETSRSNEEISSILLSSNDWSVPSLGEPLNRDELFRRFDSIALANAKASGALSDEFGKAYADSTQFVHNAFDAFEGKIEEDIFDWTFAVPARGEESQGEEYASEVTFFLPLLDPKFGVNSLVRQRTVAYLAPAVIETYKGDEAGTKGALVWTPVYLDPSARRGRQFLENLDTARYRISETAGFIRNSLQAKVMGLGAIMPGLTKSGTTIQQEGLVTTTGHGGTVHILAETVRNVAERQNDSSRIGVLGLGAIGYSSLEVLRENADNLQAKDFIVYDFQPDLMTKAVNSGTAGVATYGAESSADLLVYSDIIVTAVTKPIDLDKVEKDSGVRIDLTGKTIIDDSQPGCFDRDQVEARGGKLIWVVGEDTTQQHAFRRLQGYSFGDGGGLFGDRAVWGCEAEAGSIAMSKSYEAAVSTHVEPEIARKVGKICYEAGIRVSSPLQSFGQPVDI